MKKFSPLKVIKTLTIIFSIQILLTYLFVICQSSWHILFGWFTISGTAIVVLLLLIIWAVCLIVRNLVKKSGDPKENKQLILMILIDILIIIGWLYYYWINLMAF